MTTPEREVAEEEHYTGGDAEVQVRFVEGESPASLMTELRWGTMKAVRNRVAMTNIVGIGGLRILLAAAVLAVLTVVFSAGADPAVLVIDANRTAAAARSNPVQPGGELRVYGDFPWGRDSSRARAYFVPRSQPVQDTYDSRALAALQREGCAVEARSASAGAATFLAPDKDQILLKSGKKTAVRVIVVDEAPGGAQLAGPVLLLDAQPKDFPFGAVFASTVGILVLAALAAVVLFASVVIAALLWVRKKRRPAR